MAINVRKALLQERSSLESQISRLDRAIKLLGDEAPSKHTSPAKSTTKGGKRELSPEARQAISAAQKRRWANSKKASKG